MFDSDYDHAVLRLAWAVDRETRTRILVCAAVELLPCEVPVPVIEPERYATISGRFFLYKRDVVVSARRGLEWFEDTSRGISLRPNTDGTLGDPAAANVPRYMVGPLLPEPPANALLTATKRVPFSADWQTSVRTKHLVTEASPFRNWTAREHRNATEWLAKEAHFDLDVFPEYAGSVHLLAPNPVFRSMAVRCEKEERALLVAFVPRTGKSVGGLDLLIEEKRSTGIGVVACIKVEGPLMRVELPYFPGEIRERVFDPRRGLLYSGPFGVFGVGFNLTVNVASVVRRVDPGGGAAPYEVTLAGRDIVTNTGSDDSHRSVHATALLSRAYVARSRRSRGRANQKWFRERAPDATKALRDLIQGAKGEVFVCDPYFGGRDLFRVILAIADPRTAVRILTSAKHLKKDGGSVGDTLESSLLEALSTPQSNPIEVHVMSGSDPRIHDRFIVVGDEMWMLGASINHFGDRGTLMVKVPDPMPVREDLEMIWRESAPLKEWLERRRCSVQQ